MNITNILHQSTIRRAFLLPGILLGLAVASLPAKAAVITPDTWYSSGPAGTAVEGGGINFVTNSDSTYKSILTYFDAASLNVGDSISVSLTFSGVLGTATNGRQVAFAFFNSGGSQISASGLGQNGSTGTDRPYTVYRGYRTFMNTATTTSSAFGLQSRTINNSQLPNGNAYIDYSGNSTGGRKLVSDTLYNLTYSITRTGANTLAFSISATGEGLTNYNGSWDVTATGDGADGFTTTFDTFAITLQGPTVFDSLTLYDVSITTPATIPEPATVAMLMGGLGVLAFSVRRRR